MQITSTQLKIKTKRDDSGELSLFFWRLTMDSIKSFFEGIFGAAAGFMMITLMLCYSIGTIYWLWIAIQIGNFWMFVLGFIPPTMVFTGLIGGYLMIFGTPMSCLFFFRR